MKHLLHRFTLSAAVLAALTLTGCESEDDFDHNPPPGKGTLYVVDHTGDDVDVFIDGQETNSVDSWDKRFFDLDPGVHRVVIDDQDFERSWGGDVDILNGRRTILEVQPNAGNIDVFDVFIWFDD